MRSLSRYSSTLPLSHFQRVLRWICCYCQRVLRILYNRGVYPEESCSKDSSPTSGTSAESPVSTQVVAQPNPSTAVLTPAAQPTAAMTPAVVKRMINWYHIVLATGIPAAGGTGTVVFFKRVVVPRIKAWIKNVVSEREEEEVEKEEKQSSKVAEEAAEAAKAAASAAALVAKASQDLLSSRNEGYNTSVEVHGRVSSEQGSKADI
ncbi:peroxisomal membrane protein PEX14-like protein [Carex littledalei]|uniref:Peroxisomal membrane protein PEX14 n=1 Tax=Carex littledalei TaxID=544730 RepID=A0A833RBX7_9POAL|nr:peroxisomal membrane protein PEX14-like protein [Carex littledalei]